MKTPHLHHPSAVEPRHEHADTGHGDDAAPEDGTTVVAARTQPFLQRFSGIITSSERTQVLGQKSMTVWLTGLSGAGKSTLAFELERQLMSERRACYVLDGDSVRHGLTSDLGFSAEDRRENIRRVAHVAQLMNDAGLIVIVALISPMREDRAMAREIIGQDKFIEVYVAASVTDCERRDSKGLYAKARSGAIPSFTGVSAPYEPPTDPDLTVDTAALSKAGSVARVFGYLQDRYLSMP